ncbi:MAG: NADP-dependent malic enzyme, partial [Planctomycetaceae bacterium]|nr:NADP-dependent malic enzyme [Planctomycetaceae bacterium]
MEDEGTTRQGAKVHSDRDRRALEYHEQGRPGKLEVIPSKPCTTQAELSLAYTPGVAVPCLEIEKNPDDAYRYTNRGNLVAVISNGTAVLGLGDIGALAGKPVMEGKGVLFKRFADIDVFDIEIDEKDPEKVIETVKRLEPTFGGINLEDIKAPECFHIEQTLKRIMDIPVFHDDQHGTAIISTAGLMNALEIVGKKMGEVRVVFSGAGAAGISCAEMMIAAGVKRENILMTDSKGVLWEGRQPQWTEEKAHFVRKTKARTIGDALKGADVFVGVSLAGLVTGEMVKGMAKKPVLFAMANPTPEILPEEVFAVRKDAIMATGRSDYPNQVNNVLGFPYIFRGALDVRARAINEEMKMAASKALAALAKEDVPDEVKRAYGGLDLRFGPQYIIPKPLDPRVLLWEAPAVAEAAMRTGVARSPIADLGAYRERLERMLGKGRETMRGVFHRARRAPKRIVFPEADEEKVLRACTILIEEKAATPVLVGDEARIRKQAADIGADIEGAEIVDVASSGELEAFERRYVELRGRRGVTPRMAREEVRKPLTHGILLVDSGKADGLVCGLNRSYPKTIRPAVQILHTAPGVKRVAGMYLVVFRKKVMFFADATVNIEPDAEALAEIAVLAGRTVRSLFDVEPRVAMLSFSNFGSVDHPLATRVQEAVALVRKADPSLIVDGEMQADTALVPEIAEAVLPHSRIKGDANVLIFPDLQSGNIAYKLAQRLAEAEVIGPILMGMRRPVNVLNHWSSVSEIVNIAAITSVAACPPGEAPAPGAAARLRKAAKG